MTQKHIKNVRGFALFMLGLAVAYMLKLMTERIAYELAGPLTADSAIYLGMGRGILNGLTPYVDLFESKPPGIFLLSALSLWLTDGTKLIILTQVLCLSFIPIGFVLLTQNIARLKRCTLTRPMTALALGYGLLWALYAAFRSGEFQVESFGAAFALLYLVMCTSPSYDKHPRLHTACAGLAILGATGIKEPFILTMAAGVFLLFTHKPDKIRTRLIMPVVIAAVIGTAALALLGLLRPYAAIYLPEMFFSHAFSGGRSAWFEASGALWQRMFNYERPMRDMEKFVPYLSYATLSALLFTVWINTKDRFFRPLALSTIRLYSVPILTLLAIGLGGAYYNHHYVFGLPVYMTVFAFLLAYASSDKSMFNGMVRKSAYAFFVVAAFGFSNPDYDSLLQAQAVSQHEAKEMAQQIDDVLTACGESRYLYIGVNGISPYGYTKHSPYGPNFFQFNYYFEEHREYFRKSFLGNMLTTDVIVLTHRWPLGELKQAAREYLTENFQEEPWPCARGLVTPMEEYKMVFRKRG